jgi:hypothetical protein
VNPPRQLLRHFSFFFFLSFLLHPFRLVRQMQCHASPIYTLSRNPSFLKNFLTVGDWNARIWAEDCKESSIIWTKYCSVELTDGCWSPTKCSLFYLSRTDGSVEAWDLLQLQSEPILTMKVCSLPATSILIPFVDVKAFGSLNENLSVRSGRQSIHGGQQETKKNCAKSFF